MQWFEKVYKDRFSSDNLHETESDLEGIDSSELWAQISKSIPQHEPTKIALPWWRVLGVLLFLGLLAAGLIFFNISTQTNKLTSAQNKTNIVKQNNKPNSKNLSSSLKTQNLNTQNSKLQESNIQLSKPGAAKLNSEPNKTIPIAVTDSKTTGIDRSVPKPINKDNLFSGSNTITLPNQKETLKKSYQNEQKRFSNHLDSYTDDIRSSSDNGVLNSTMVDEAPNEHSSVSTNDKVNSLKNQNTSISMSIPASLDSRTKIIIDKLVREWILTPERKIASPLLNPINIPTNITKSPNPWSIKLSTQINIFDLQYKDDTNGEDFADQAIQSIDSLQYGSGFGIHLCYELNRTWTLSAGIESNRYKNELNTVINIDTTAFDDNEDLRKAKYTRTVKRTNRINTITIPVNISYDYSLNQKFGLGTSVGLAYSLVTSQSGRILGRNNSIIDYDSELHKQYENYLSFRFNSYIRYQLLENFEISMDVGFSMQNHGSSAIIDLKQGSTISTVGLGMKFSFN